MANDKDKPGRKPRKEPKKPEEYTFEELEALERKRRAAAEALRRNLRRKG